MRDQNQKPFVRTVGSGRHPNKYWYIGASRRRAPSWLLRPLERKKTVKKGPLWLYVFVGIIVLLFASSVALIVASIFAPFTVAMALYGERYNTLSLEKDYSLAFETTRIYDRKGILLYEKQPDEGLRQYATYDKIPKVLIDATTAAEDPSFFENKGVDPYALVRAAYINLSQRGSSGASTITQQVARIVYLPAQQRQEQSFDRKVDEIILATKLTNKVSKEQILEKYLNNIYYGNLAYGAEAAALGYFGKDVKDISLAEASMLAGLPQAPSLYDPTKDYNLARKRQKIVLDLMVKYNRTTQAEADAAYAVDLSTHLVDRRQKKAFIQAPHFVNFILQQLEGTIDAPQFADMNLTPDDFSRGGYDIYTTIDLDLVNQAQQVVKDNVDELRKRKASNAALVAIRPSTGEILSMVGSTDYNNTENQGQFNAAIARRQPGSALKPLTYAFAMKKGWTAATVLADVPTDFPSGTAVPYTPHNFDGKTHGPVSVRNSLGSSLNIPAVKALQFDGVDTFIKEAKDMGVTFQYGPERYGLTLTLGGGEVRLLDLTGAYSVFDNLGDKVDTISILKVVRRNETIYEFKPENVKRRNVLSPQISYVITNILSDNEARLLAFARNNPLVLDRPAAAKTGTSNDFVDSWTIGYTPDLVVGVWVGNNNNSPMDGVAGSVGGGIVWNKFMTSVYKDPYLAEKIKPGGQLQTDFVRPGDIEEVTICVESGLLPNDACPQKRKELFPKADVPTKVTDIERYASVPANQYCIPDDSWPAYKLTRQLFYVYPPELEQWAISQGRRPPPTQYCGTYVAPTPVPTQIVPTVSDETPTKTAVPIVTAPANNTHAPITLPNAPDQPPPTLVLPFTPQADSPVQPRVPKPTAPVSDKPTVAPVKPPAPKPTAVPIKPTVKP